MKRIILCFILFFGGGTRLFAQSVEQSVSVQTKDGVVLEGTLLIPQLEQSNTTPVALIISGSGPTNRNGNNRWMPNNSLRMLAEGLAENGIATIRYDKRGVGESFNADIIEDSLTIYTYSEDALRWVEFLAQDKRFGELTIIGHNEGAKVALIVASENNNKVDRIVMIAGDGKPRGKILREQFKRQSLGVREQIEPIAGVIIDSLEMGRRVERVPMFLNPVFRPSLQNFVISSLRVNPVEVIKKVTVPILIIHGTTDIQSALSNAKYLKEAKPEAELVIIEGMNHVLKECEEMNPQLQTSTYSNPSLPLHQELLPSIVRFIK